MTYQTKTKAGRLLLGASLGLALSAMSVSADTIRFWTTEEQPERLAKQQEMAKQFEAETGTAERFRR